MPRSTVFLLHSGGFTSRQWRRLRELLAARFDVVAPDFLGYGSQGTWPEREPFHFHRDVELIESLVRGPVHLVGHSYGGLIALHFALRRPDLVRSIAVYEPVAMSVLRTREDDDALQTLRTIRRTWKATATTGVDEEWLRDFVEWWNGEGAWDRLPAETRDAFRVVGWKLFQEVMTLTADATSGETYATIAAPTLLLRGDASPLAERRVVERLSELLPRATLRSLPGVGHMGPISHPAIVNDAIGAHLEAHA
jgi:pimeloyl-ACP methyl ester carboxylesterase